MHHPVPKIRGENLARFGLGHDKALGWSGAIRAVMNLLLKFPQIGPEMDFKPDLGGIRGLAQAAAFVGYEQVMKSRSTWTQRHGALYLAVR